jgi:hypothetical protein
MATIDHEYYQKANQMEKHDVDITPIDKSISATNEQYLDIDVELQPAGLMTLSGIKSTWNAKSLAFAWGGATALSFVVAYDQTTSSSFAPYATSDFGELSLLGTIGTIQGVISAGMCYCLYLCVQQLIYL